MTKKISQRSVIKLKRRVKELEDKLHDLSHGYAGTQIDRFVLYEAGYAKLKTAQTLGYTTILYPTYSGGFSVEIRAVKL